MNSLLVSCLDHHWPNVLVFLVTMHTLCVSAFMSYTSTGLQFKILDLGAGTQTALPCLPPSHWRAALRAGNKMRPTGLVSVVTGTGHSQVGPRAPALAASSPGSTSGVASLSQEGSFSGLEQSVYFTFTYNSSLYLLSHLPGKTCYFAIIFFSGRIN